MRLSIEVSLRSISPFVRGGVERSLGFDVTRKGKTGPMSEGPSIDD
jgi:hypothetical protein